MTQAQIQSYINFMHNSSNIMNCKDCPENIGASDWQGNKPCGQQNCWVEVHLRKATPEE